MWVGADPGGENNFGLAVLHRNGEAQCWTVSSAAEALSMISGTPLGVGIDAPLWWSADIGGKRNADAWLRRTYGIASGTVQSPNSLRGAALVQGAILAELLRKSFPQIGVTEAHPKALLKSAVVGDVECLFDNQRVTASPANEHERDAVIAAICAREGFEGRWKCDLATKRNEFEQDPQRYWLAPVHYWWPDGL